MNQKWKIRADAAKNVLSDSYALHSTLRAQLSCNDAGEVLELLILGSGITEGLVGWSLWIKVWGRTSLRCNAIELSFQSKCFLQGKGSVLPKDQRSQTLKLKGVAIPFHPICFLHLSPTSLSLTLSSLVTYSLTLSLPCLSCPLFPLLFFLSLYPISLLTSGLTHL